MTGIVTDNLTNDLIAVTISLLVGLVLYYKWCFTYWEKRGLPSLKPTFPFGNISKLIMKQYSLGEQFKQHYNEIKAKGWKHGGIYFFTQPFYIPTDPEIIKHIMQTDFPHFVNHATFLNEENDPLSGHLFNLKDARWKNMRIKLTPTFTSGKMKMMFPTMANTTIGLKSIMETAALNGKELDIKDVLGRFSTDVIGSCAFGIECNSLKNPDVDFRKYGRKFFELNMWESFKNNIQFAVPKKFLYMIKFRITPKSIEEFFFKIVLDVVNYREKNNIFRKDFMHLLLQLKNRGKVSDDENVVDIDKKNSAQGLTMEELVAQAFVFFLAGFETSSTAMTFALLELALNPEIQQKLREEINNVLVKYNNEMTYEAMADMTYLERVIHETLRKYPPVPTLNRQCTKDYIIPNTNVKIERGIQVAISPLAIHNDPEYYPNPEKFDPDRFTEENKNKRPAFTWLPFGDGPRVCIGLRFGILQTKVGLTTLLRDYEISLNSKTKLPIVFEKGGIVSAVVGGVWLNVKKIGTS